MRGWCCRRGAQRRQVFRGRAGGPAVAELELEATHTHTENIILCIHHKLEQLAIANEARQLQAQARGRAQLGSIRPHLLLQLPLQPQLQYRRWQAQFSSLRGQGRPINNGSGTCTKITQIQGGNSTRPLVRGCCCRRGAHRRQVFRGRARGPTVAELELEATHTQRT